MAIQLLKQEMFNNYNTYVHCKWRFRNINTGIFISIKLSPHPLLRKKNIIITVSENLNTMDKHIVHNYTCMYNDLKIRHSSLYVTCIILRYLSETPSMQPPPLKMAFYLDVKYIHFTLAYIYSDVLNTST